VFCLTSHLCYLESGEPVIHHGDLFDVLPTLPAESIHACVTDPPYELGFMGKSWDASGVAIQPETWAHIYRLLKPGAHVLAFGGTRTFHRMAVAIEDAGFEVRDCLSWLYGSGFPKSLNFHDGWGTALKPAWEPIVLARKPFKGGVAACREAHGTGALNVDGCRIEHADDPDGFSRHLSTEKHEGWQRPWNNDPAARERAEARKAVSAEKAVDLGRWPANVCMDESAAAMLDAQSGDLVSGANPTRRSSDKFRDTYSAFKGQTECDPARGLDVGGASRFYYVAKPSRAERDMGCSDLQPRQRDESRKDGNPGGDNPRNRGLQPRGNHHPTVKPVELMRWLVRLVTPPGGTVLDPFTGSGTTGMACAYEGVRFVGVEREAEYVAIAERRIAACVPLLASEQPA
jgi:site-specific DNA-methyltransferase (adenine-specific)